MRESMPMRSALFGRGWPVRWVCAIFGLSGVAYLFVMLDRQRIESMDFRYVWLAGNLWSDGRNPYGPAYLEAGARWFPDGYAIASWAYPFHWYPIARLAALGPPEPAFTVWLIVTTCALVGAFWLVAAAARRVGVGLSASGYMLLAGYAASGSVVGYALRAGQPAVLSACGVALCLFGMARDRRWVIVAGLVLAMLKPQIGLPFATALLFQRGGFKTVTIAALVVILACVPSFVASGLAPQLRGLLATSSGTYQLVSYNSAVMMSGLPHLAWMITGQSMSITVSMLIAAVATGLVALRARSYRRDDAMALLPPLLCALTAALVGLHTYDLIIVLFTIPFLPALGRWQRWLAIGALLLLWRTENLVGVATGTLTLLPTLQTAALIVILAVFSQAFVSAGSGRLPGSGPTAPS